MLSDDLRASILSQADAPGSALTESAVALRFGVARPTARLAIDKLVADGLLRREPNSAARVPVLTRDDIVDIFENRALIEAAAMASLAKAGAIPALALEAHRSLLQSNDFARHDVAFHRALVAGQPSMRLTRMHSLLMGEVELGIGQVQAAALLTADQIAHQHQGILDAITAGDAEAAGRLARAHVVGTRNLLVAHYDSTNP